MINAEGIGLIELKPEICTRAIAALVAAGDRRSRLNTIAVPTRVVHGSADPLFLPVAGEDTAANISGAEFRLFEGMGHEVPPELYGPLTRAIAHTRRVGTT